MRPAVGSLPLRWPDASPRPPASGEHSDRFGTRSLPLRREGGKAPIEYGQTAFDAERIIMRFHTINAQYQYDAHRIRWGLLT